MPRSEPRLLVVDDELEMARLLADELGEAGYAVTLAASGAEGVERVRREPFDVVLTDLRMEGTDGFDVLAAALAADPAMPVLIMTAFATVDTAVEAMKRGAYHYLSKPFRLDEVRLLVGRALDHRRVRAENRALRQASSDRASLRSLVGRSGAMKAVYTLIDRVAASPAPVLLRGESGTGKELVARAIHLESPRKDAAFVPVNCTAIPGSLLESELFGHLRGAFTGASSPRRGLFVEADGGTLFLDEIGDMSAELQAKLLRVLEDGEVRAVGADAPRRVDVRIVAATHQELEARIAEGKFRQDLFYRLNVVPLRLPSLRERREDIPLLVEHFLGRARGRNPRARLEQLAPEAMTAVARAGWPGNVRELENFIERLAVVCDQAVAGLADVQPLLPVTVEPHPLEGAHQEVVPLRKLEDDYITWAVARCGGNKTRAAELLGIDVSTIHRREREKER